MAMSETATNPYDAVAYPGRAFMQTHPSRLAAIAHFHGLDAAPMTGMRVLELGCGRGGNLIPMAFQYPQARFVGIDLSGASIAQAKANAAEFALANLDFQHRDIMDAGAELGSFDYIIVHGVYSWVPDPVRRKIVALFGELLAPRGVAYVSYNALPGCRMRDLSRDVMLYATRHIEDPRERVRVARASLETFAEASDPDSFHGAALRMRLKQIEEIPDSVLYHDDLNPGARAFALHEVLDAARRHGLQYLSEASFPNMYGAAKGPAQAMLAAIPPENVELREQSLDLVIGRAFRETLLCREGHALRRGITATSLRPYHLAANASLAGDTAEEARPGVQNFVFDAGVKLAVDLPLAKAALRRLGEAWPGAVAWDDLVRLSRADAADELASDWERERDRLEEALIAIFKAGLLDFRLEPPPLTTVVSERPAASDIARWQASSSSEVTDLRHRMVHLNGVVVRKFVSLLDGSRTPEMLLDEINAFLAETHAAGVAIPNLPQRATADEVAMHLRDVARLGLLHA